jgi:hypothetical protein
MKISGPDTDEEALAEILARAEPTPESCLTQKRFDAGADWVPQGWTPPEPPADPSAPTAPSPTVPILPIDSFSGEDAAYRVDLRAKTCICADFLARHAGHGMLCKHLRALPVEGCQFSHSAPRRGSPSN